MNTAACPQAFVPLAEEMAAAAGEVVRRYFRTALDVQDKPDDTPVTKADREAEARIREIIVGRHPDHGVVGEEQGSDRPEAEYVWVLDPIDGTKKFITGNPLFGTLIALLHEGRPVLGVIDMPMLGERWIGAAGRATRFEDRQGARDVRVRPCAELAGAVLSATTPHMFGKAEFPAFERVRRAARTVLYGGDCFAYGALASGHLDLVVEADMDAYDFMALVPVVTGAGGVMTDWTGGALGLEADGRVIAAGDRRVHAAALELLAGG
jgi:histidinol phosphatase-like enzyme (inositol monophosphatase family)